MKGHLVCMYVCMYVCIKLKDLCHFSIFTNHQKLIWSAKLNGNTDV